MKNKFSYVVTMLLLFSLVMVACGGNNGNNEAAESNGSSANPTSGASSDGIDNSKEVKLSMYLLGDAPKGMPEVLEQVNTKLKEKSTPRSI